MAEADEQTTESPPVRWGMGDALLGNGASLVLSVVAVSIAAGVSGRTELEDLPLWATAVLQVPLWAGLLGTAWLASTRKGRGSLRADFGLQMRPRDVPIGLAAGLGAQLVITIIVINLYELFGVDTDRIGETAEELTDRAVGAVDVTLLLSIVVIGAPIVEEVFYRGLWLRSIQRRTGSPAIALVGSSLIFGAIHFQPFDLVALSLAGLVFAWLTLRFERLGPAIWAHLAFNLTAVISLLASG